MQRIPARYRWIVASLLLAECAGCSWFAKKSEPSQAFAPPKPTWTDKISSTFKGKSTKKKSSDESTFPPAEKVTPDAELMVGLAEAAERAGKPDEAKRLYDRALTQKADCLPALLGSARLLDRQGKLDEAVASYRKTLTKFPKEGTVYNDLGLCLERQGKLSEALACFDQAVRLQPEKQLYRNNFAAALVQANRPNEALQQLAAVHPPAIAHFNLGCMLLRGGNEQGAAVAFKQALSIDGNLTVAQQYLAQLSPPTSPKTESRQVDNSQTRPASTNDGVDGGATLVIRTNQNVPTEETMVAHPEPAADPVDSAKSQPTTMTLRGRASHDATANPLRQLGGSIERLSLRPASEPKNSANQEIATPEPPLDWSKPAEDFAAPVAPTPPQIQMPGSEPEPPQYAPVKRPTRNVEVEYPESMSTRPQGSEALPPSPGRYNNG